MTAIKCLAECAFNRAGTCSKGVVEIAFRNSDEPVCFDWREPREGDDKLWDEVEWEEHCNQQMSRA